MGWSWLNIIADLNLNLKGPVDEQMDRAVRFLVGFCLSVRLSTNHFCHLLEKRATKEQWASKTVSCAGDRTYSRHFRDSFCLALDIKTGPQWTRQRQEVHKIKLSNRISRTLKGPRRTRSKNQKGEIVKPLMSSLFRRLALDKRGPHSTRQHQEVQRMKPSNLLWCLLKSPFAFHWTKVTS